jgi:N-succinyldiaminopimelate aminotransferase
MKNIFKDVPKTGVIYVMHEAEKLGFTRGDDNWCNLGQGQAESGFIEGGVKRIKNIKIEESDNEYSPVSGLYELRAAIAESYNLMYRDNLKSKYSHSNVAICPGGRAALTRIAASLGNINFGHFIPDYTAYEEMLGIFNSLNTIPILLNGSNGYSFSSDSLKEEIKGRGISSILLSNPCNPTGKLISKLKLKKWIETINKTNCSMIIDEFYSNYIYSGELGSTVSAAKYIDDVNKDNIIIVNGLTKNWRYPGWRIAWILAPEEIISSISSSGSFLDGGPNRPFQKAAIDLVSQENIQIEAKAIQSVFRKKRRVILDSLQEMGVTFDIEPNGAFYAWGNVSSLPGKINSGKSFFKACLEEKVIVVPGEFFDINPGKRRTNSRFKDYVRFSFGPNIETIKEAMLRIRKVINLAKS